VFFSFAVIIIEFVHCHFCVLKCFFFDIPLYVICLPFVYATLLLKNYTITYYFLSVCCLLFIFFSFFSFSLTNIFVGGMRVSCCLFRTLILYVLTVLFFEHECLFGWFFFFFYISFFLRVPFFQDI